MKIAAEIAAPGNLNLSKKSATVRSIPFPGADPPLSFVRNIPAVTPAHIGGIPDPHHSLRSHSPSWPQAWSEMDTQRTATNQSIRRLN